MGEYEVFGDWREIRERAGWERATSECGVFCTAKIQQFVTREAGGYLITRREINASWKRS